MSFTSEVKNQICKDEVDANASKAQLCALFQIRASLHMNWQGMYLSFQSDCQTRISTFETKLSCRSTISGIKKNAVKKEQYLSYSSL